MTIKIGERELETQEPQDLNKILLATKGCSAEEAKGWLRGSPIAGLVAAALSPFLVDKSVSTPELAGLIGAAGPALVAADVMALYEPAPAPAPEAPANGE